MRMKSPIPAHVILRYRLEQALIAGDLAIADYQAPGTGDEEPALPDAAQRPRGCLQDIHWYEGFSDIFLLQSGAMTAAQLWLPPSRRTPASRRPLPKATSRR